MTAIAKAVRLRMTTLALTADISPLMQERHSSRKGKVDPKNYLIVQVTEIPWSGQRG